MKHVAMKWNLCNLCALHASENCICSQQNLSLHICFRLTQASTAKKSSYSCLSLVQVLRIGEEDVGFSF